MIASLRGTVSEKLPDVVILDVGGVGYSLFVTTEDYGQLPTDQPVKVYIHEHIREQSHDLFGFVRLDTKQLFEQLLGVNGVGPKMALAVLSIGSASDVRGAIAGGDTKYIQAAQGVGKRVAERIVVDLKDKVGLAGVDLTTTGIFQGEALVQQDEAVEALVSLGYSVQDASVALSKIDPNLPAEQRITMALRGQ